MSVSVTFLGAAGTVTGAKFLLETPRGRLLLECGLFQGLRDLRERNWIPLPAAASSIGAVVLSHAHIDHSGYLPRLARDGFRGPVFTSPGTADLLRIMLPDAAHLQEEEAEFRNRKGATRHRPALPLFTTADAEAALALVEPVPFGRVFAPLSGVEVRLRPSGHILGASTVDVVAGGRRLVYSGDLGRYGVPVMRDPDPVAEADLLLVESTYGNRRHPEDDGTPVLVDAVPVFLDSPMGAAATAIYARHPEEHDPDTVRVSARGGRPFAPARFSVSRTVEDSKRLNDLAGPAIIIAGSGMATGGRILHHLRRRLDDRRTVVLFVGYQAAGTRGRSLREGAGRVRIFGEEVSVRATILATDALSAHADRGEILRWLRGFRRPPSTTFVVHGEPEAAVALRDVIEQELGWRARVAADGATAAL